MFIFKYLKAYSASILQTKQTTRTFLIFCFCVDATYIFSYHNLINVHFTTILKIQTKIRNKEEIYEKEIPFGIAIIPIIITVAVMMVTIVVLKQSPHVPLIIGTTVASIVAWRYGYKWNDLEEAMYKGIRLALPAIVIIILVGLTIGAWIGGGIVATMIYYGLKLLTPSLFLVSITVICSIVALAIGSSWSTMGTIGVAGMGIGLSMGIPAPMVAGAIISGSYFGDKMSPLSDTTNLAAGLTNTDLFTHIRHMLFTTIPGLIITLIVYAFLGRSFGANNIDAKSIEQTLQVLQQNFVISPFLLIIPIVVMVLVAKRFLLYQPFSSVLF